MRLHGWCLKCHKIRRVRVTMPRSSGVQVGVCDACDNQQKEEQS